MSGKIYLTIFITLSIAQILSARTIFKIPNTSTKVNLEHVLTDLERQLEIVAKESGGNLVTSIRCLERAQPSLRELEYTLQEVGECQGKQDCEQQLLKKVSILQVKILNDFHKCLILRTPTQVLTKAASFRSSKKMLDQETISEELEQKLDDVANKVSSNIVTSLRCLEHVQPLLEQLKDLTLEGIDQCQQNQDCVQKLQEKIAQMETRIVNDFEKCLILRTSVKSISFTSSKKTGLGNILTNLERQLEIIAKESGGNLVTNVRCLERAQPSLRKLEHTLQELGECQGKKDCEQQLLEKVSILQAKILNDFHKCLIWRTPTQVLTKAASFRSKEILDPKTIAEELEQKLDDVANKVSSNIVTSLRCLEHVQPLLEQLKDLTLQGIEQCQQNQDCVQQLQEKIAQMEAEIVNNFEKCLILRSPVKSTSFSASKKTDLGHILTDLERQLEIVAKESGGNLVTSVRCLERAQPSLRELEYTLQEVGECQGKQDCEQQLLKKVSILQVKILNNFHKCLILRTPTQVLTRSASSGSSKIRTNF